MILPVLFKEIIELTAFNLENSARNLLELVNRYCKNPVSIIKYTQLGINKNYIIQ